MSKRKISIILGLLIIGALLNSCSLPRSDRPSVLVIAVENLGVNELNCSRESRNNSRSGFDLLCEEGIGFVERQFDQRRDHSFLCLQLWIQNGTQRNGCFAKACGRDHGGSRFSRAS